MEDDGKSVYCRVCSGLVTEGENFSALLSVCGEGCVNLLALNRQCIKGMQPHSEQLLNLATNHTRTPQISTTLICFL